MPSASNSTRAAHRPQPIVIAATTWRGVPDGRVALGNDALMGLWSDRALRRSVGKIGYFWLWWEAGGRDAAGRTVDGHGYEDFDRAISPRVADIDRDLSWHTEPGTTKRHRLVLSAAGAIEKRGIAERWRRAAPNDDLWEFAAAKSASPASAGAVLTHGGHELPVEDARFVITEGRALVDLAVEHPTFREMPQQVRAEAALIMLDVLFGEDDVERYVGRVDAVAYTAGATATAAEVRDAIERTRANDAWTLASLTLSDGSKALLGIGPRLHPLDHLPFDRHTTVAIRYKSRGDGLADRDEVQRVQAAQREFEETLGGTAVTVLTEMHAGIRTVHFYSDSADQNVEQTFATLARGGRGIRVRHEHDPKWRAVQEFRRW